MRKKKQKWKTNLILKINYVSLGTPEFQISFIYIAATPSKS